MSTSRNWPPPGGKGNNADIIKQGYLRKLKTKKKKYFVLRGDSGDTSARLEYYDSEKKWKANQPPKRSIVLKTCFNINKRIDYKQKWVIALYTKRDCFCIDFDNEEEMDSWLKALLKLQLGEDIPDGIPIKPTFEHVWPVSVLNKELGGRAGILGPYHLCLTDQSLSLVKVASDDKLDSIEFSLQKIRRCGHVDSFFYMEVGQCTVTGAGNLWMQTEDTNIAKNMHATILRNCSKKDLQPKSKPNVYMMERWSTPIEEKDVLPKSEMKNALSTSPTCTQQQSASSGSSGGGSGGLSVNHQRTYSFPLSPLPPTRRASTGTRPSKFITSNLPQTSVRDRCDSLPSRACTNEGVLIGTNRTHLAPSHNRPHSMHNKGLSYSPPISSTPVSPGSGACSDSAGSSLSMDGDSTDVTWETESTVNLPIMEENCDDYAPWTADDEKLNNNIHLDQSVSLPFPITTTSNIIMYRKQSPNPGFKSSSPSQTQSPYMDMGSPCESSPLDPPSSLYLAISPGETRTPFFVRAGSANHSRGSSLTEDGYVTMAPGSNKDYVEMDSKSFARTHNKDRYQSGDTSAGSSCSITSGTPSTDIRLSEYTLDKVTTYFTPEEDIGPTERQARAYSVGSRPVLAP